MLGITMASIKMSSFIVGGQHKEGSRIRSRVLSNRGLGYCCSRHREVAGSHARAK